MRCALLTHITKSLYEQREFASNVDSAFRRTEVFFLFSRNIKMSTWFDKLAEHGLLEAGY